MIALAAAIATLAVPATAQAALAYVRYAKSAGGRPPTLGRPYVLVAADEGANPRRVDFGSNPHVSPDGQTVVYQREGQSQVAGLAVAASGGGASRTLMSNWRDPFYLAFSPDSKTIAALRGGELGSRKLVLIDVASGAQRTIASGFFNGFSFSPDGTELVFGRATSERFPPRTDVFRVPTSGGKPFPITHDRRSEDPLWGPTGQIVFVKTLGAKKRRYGPKNELYLMKPSGGQVRRLTHTKVDPLLQGLFPTDWSADGQRLLAEFEGQDTSYAVAVNPRTGAQRPVGKAGEQGFVGTALSSDGKSVLGFTGGFEPGPDHNVATVPYSGGKPKALAKNAFEPAWSR